MRIQGLELLSLHRWIYLSISGTHECVTFGIVRRSLRSVLQDRKPRVASKYQVSGRHPKKIERCAAEHQELELAHAVSCFKWLTASIVLNGQQPHILLQNEKGLQQQGNREYAATQTLFHPCQSLSRFPAFMSCDLDTS